MASHKPTLQHELEQYNDSLDACLRSQYGMTLKTFKVIKGLTQLLGTAGGVYALSLGSPPLATFFLMALIIVGPEGMEYLIEHGGAA